MLPGDPDRLADQRGACLEDAIGALADVLDRYFDGAADDATDARLRG